LAASSLSQGSARDPSSPLIWSGDRPDLLEWGPLDDVVMGGVSKSSFTVQNGVGRFAGAISTENNGGFAGCRSRAITPPLQLQRFSGLKLRVRGDGKRYKLIVRDDYNWNGIAWSFSFDTEPAQQLLDGDGSGDGSGDDFVDVLAPWASFVPTLFARKVPLVQLKTDSITAVQLTLSKFEYDSELNPAFSTGPFELQIASIEAF